MINGMYLRAYALSFTFAYILALLSANLVSLAMKENWAFFIVLVVGPFFSVLPFFCNRDLIPKDFSTTFSSLPRRMQVLSVFYRVFILYAIPFFILLMLPKHRALMMSLLSFYTLVLIMQTTIFPFGVDDFSSRMMACCLPLILAGFTGAVWSVLLVILVVPFMLSGITFFLLMHNFLNHRKKQALQFIKMATAANFRIFFPAVFLALTISFLLYAFIPDFAFLPVQSGSLNFENLIPEIFGSRLLGLFLYFFAALLVMLALFKLLTRYLKLQSNRKLASSGTDYEIESFRIAQIITSRPEEKWDGVRLKIITSYINVRSMIKRMEERFSDAMTPGEFAVDVGDRFPEIQVDLKRLTQIFQWARYSQSEPKKQEGDIAAFLALKIVAYLKELK